MRKILPVFVFLLAPSLVHATTCASPYAAYGTCTPYTDAAPNIYSVQAQSFHDTLDDPMNPIDLVRLFPGDVSSNSLNFCVVNGMVDDECMIATLINSGKSLDSRLSTVEGKFSGTTSQYIRGNGTLAAFPTITSPQAYEGIAQRTGAFPIFKSATVSTGTAVFNLTTDGTSGGTTLCTNGVIQDSVTVGVSDSAASYQMAWTFSNSNKTLTVTTNKLTTANILTGILGQASGNGSVVKLQVWCY